MNYLINKIYKFYLLLCFICLKPCQLHNKANCTYYIIRLACAYTKLIQCEPVNVTIFVLPTCAVHSY